MEKYYSLRIPSPCLEDWNLMSPSEKGRFCNSCAKTVIDFTTMSQDDIQDFLINNQGKKICGHVKQSQLGLIQIKIPVEVMKTYGFGSRSFLWALLIVMGTTILSCTDNHGNKKKIYQVEVVDTLLNDDVIPVTGGIENQITPPPPPEHVLPAESTPSKKDSILPDKHVVKPTDPINDDEIILMVGELDLTTTADKEVNFFTVDQVPEFPATPKILNRLEKENHFQEQINKHVDAHLNQELKTNMRGHIRTYTRFTINESGKIDDIQIISQHALFEKEIRRVLALLPDFKPAEHQGARVSITYVLPVMFIDN